VTNQSEFTMRTYGASLVFSYSLGDSPPPAAPAPAPVALAH
jgi:hypothetical protein